MLWPEAQWFPQSLSRLDWRVRGGSFLITEVIRFELHWRYKGAVEPLEPDPVDRPDDLT